MPVNRDVLLRVIVALHFVYTSMALLANWLPMSYILSQMAIIFIGLWAIVDRENVIQVELLMVIKFISIFLDIIAIGMYYTIGRLSCLGYYNCYFTQSAFFAIFLLLLKPVMIILLNKVRQDRIGTGTSPTFGRWGLGTANVPGYQPVDQQQSTMNV